ncbi:MAG: hypothetical protein RLY43_1778 [Bacteroidota bacterium]|jgi:hypothetical protein
MTENYSFNPDQNRYDTLEKKCVYCKKELSIGDETNHYQELFLEGKRLNILIYRKVKYTSFFICIPRCKKCKYIHNKSESTSNNWSWFLAILLFIFLKFYVELTTFFSIIFASILLLILQRKFLQDNLKKHKITSKTEGAKDVQLVQQFLNEGWQLEKPIA